MAKQKSMTCITGSANMNNITLQAWEKMTFYYLFMYIHDRLIADNVSNYCTGKSNVTAQELKPNLPNVSPHSQEVLLQQSLCLSSRSEFTATRVVLWLHHLHLR